MNEGRCRTTVKRRATEDEVILCEVRIDGVCQGLASEYQHRKNRSQCSKDEKWAPSNGIMVCGFGNTSGCHGFIHQNPTIAYEMGWSIKQADTIVTRQIKLWHGWVFLDDFGDTWPAPPPVKVDGRYRLFTASYPGKCSRCGREYRPGMEIERLRIGYAGPCCLQRPPSQEI